MLTAAAVCPHPPMLVPEVAVGHAAVLDGVRASCDEVVRRVLAVRPDLLGVVGSGDATCTYGTSAGGSLAPYGVDVRVGVGVPVLPLSLTIGVWLLERHAVTCPVRLHAVRGDAPADVCLRLGRGLATAAERIGLIVMGDGTARRGDHSPGYTHPRAAAFDAEVASALAAGDAGVLTRLDSELARELLVAGRAPWQVLAGAAGEARFTAELLANDIPYGVSYFVASWLRGG